MLHHLFMSNKVGQEHVVGHGGTPAGPHGTFEYMWPVTRGQRNSATGACSSMYQYIYIVSPCIST